MRDSNAAYKAWWEATTAKDEKDETAVMAAEWRVTVDQYRAWMQNVIGWLELVATPIQHHSAALRTLHWSWCQTDQPPSWSAVREILALLGYEEDGRDRIYHLQFRTEAQDPAFYKPEKE